MHAILVLSSWLISGVVECHVGQMKPWMPPGRRGLCNTSAASLLPAAAVYHIVFVPATQELAVSK